MELFEGKGVGEGIDETPIRTANSSGAGVNEPKQLYYLPVNKKLFATATCVWLVETLVSGFNYFILMNLIYQPRWGELTARQIGMSTRIVYIFIFAYLLLRYIKKYTTKDLVLVGLLWLGLEEIFEWGGSFVLRRPVSEILIGWNITKGYMWPYVMAAYLFSNLIVGLIFHPGKPGSDAQS